MLVAMVMIIEQLRFTEFSLCATPCSKLSIHFIPTRACEAGMVFPLGAQRTFCRDHKPNSQEVNWLWVLEAIKLSLALDGGYSSSSLQTWEEEV